MNDTLRVHTQYDEAYQACYQKVLPQLVELYGPDLGRKNAEKYSELSARMFMLQQHKKIRACRAKVRGHKAGSKPPSENG